MTLHLHTVTLSPKMVDTMREPLVLEITLVVAFILAPWMTNRFFLGNSRRYALAHAAAGAVVVVTLAAGSGVGAPLWALFCVGGFALHALRMRSQLRTPWGLASCVPFVFSVVSAVWFVAATNDLALLGYNRAWSFYAALHGCVLGWLLVGCVAHLARQPRAHPLFLWACYAVLPLFLCVAFGIDGVAYIKRIGVCGLAVLVPAVIVRFALDVRTQGGRALALALVSLAGVLASFGLALANEFWDAFPRVALGMSTMVLTHGVLNALVVVPCFLFAVRASGAAQVG